MNQTHSELVGDLHTAPQVAHRFTVSLHIHRILRLAFTAYIAFILAGGSAITAEEAMTRRLAMAVAGYEFDLLPWEMNALGEKARAFVAQPANGLSTAEATQLVRDYLDRAQKMRELEDKINRILSETPAQTHSEAQQLQQAIHALRQQQDASRETVEQVIERQVASILAAEGLEVAGIPLPPVQFAFVEPPRKLIVSPRERIETIYGQMLDAAMSLDEVEQAERTIRQQENLSAYITGIGGLGAYPTMVIDSASLSWVVSTVAHEWTHNYLTFYPLGFNYGVTSDNIIINETVAELVGIEIGERVLRTYYPDLVPLPTAPVPPGGVPAPLHEPPVFDLNTEMRTTRLRVDELLASGKVEEAERYMEARRIYFVENGYPLRVLNQAFFAFHGSYGTGAASTSPLGPQLQRLRALTPDVKTFLQTVRSFTSPADVDHALAEWGARGE